MSLTVSVIIPAYNAEKYITECLDSVLNQSYRQLEIVVVNDGSSDGTKEILDRYSGEYSFVKVIHTENRGVSCARNTGLDAAAGDCVMFLDADDFLALNAIEILMSDMLENNADISAGEMKANIDNNAYVSDKNDFEIWEGIDALRQSLLDDPFTYSSCAKLFKREALDGVRFVEGRRIHEDSYFVFCTFLKMPRVIVRNAVIYNYRLNPNGASRAPFSEKYFDILYFADKKFEAVETKAPELIDCAKNMLVKSNIAMLQCLLKADSKQYKKEIRDCIRTVKKYSKSFVPTYLGDKKRFLIIRYNLYRVYKILYRIKYS